MTTLSDSLLDAAAQGDLGALVELDRHGFLLGGSETAVELAERLRGFRERLLDMERELAGQGRWRIEDVTLAAADRIPQALFKPLEEVTRRHYGFAIDWVPGFYVDPSYGWLFGGCAYYFHPDFFALFIIRKSFASKERWLIYDRSELLAHELCHVARTALHSEVFEEEFAYRTSSSGFRRQIGGIFQSPRDSYLLLGSTFLLLFAQLVQSLFLPALWIWPFWAIVLAVVAGLVGKGRKLRGTMAKALRNLEGVVAGQQAAALLFRCTDEEILTIAGLADAAQVTAWLQSRTGWRWKVIEQRFLHGE